MADKFTEFDYLLHAVENAASEKYPAKAGFAGKRQALLRHVRELERKASLWNLIESMWSFPGQTLGDLVRRIAAERAANDAKVPLPPLPDHTAPEHHAELQRLSDEAVAHQTFCDQTPTKKDTP